MRSTKLRSGSCVVRNVPIIRQSCIAITGAGPPLGGVGGKHKELLGTIGNIHMRILLVNHKEARLFQHRFSEMAMEVEFGANDDVRSGNLAHPRENVALAVVIAVGRHGAVKGKQSDVHRHSGLKISEELVSQFLIDGAHDGAAGLGIGAKPFGNLPSALRRTLPPNEQLGRAIVFSPLCGIAMCKKAFFETTPAGRQRGK